MTVYIIGAGPGDPKLLTLRAAELIESCPVVLYAGSLVPAEAIARARPDARVIDSASLTLDEIVAIMRDAHELNQDVARVHSGDPTVFSSIAEQIRRLVQLGIAYEIVPGVSSFSAAAAVLGKELTLPELSQTVVLTRAEGRTPIPEGESLRAIAQHGATLCLFLSVTLLRRVAADLIPSYGPDCPVVVVYRATCPDQQIVTGTLSDIAERVRATRIRTQSMVLVGKVLTADDFADSHLYNPAFSHRYRRATRVDSHTEQRRATRVDSHTEQPADTEPAANQIDPPVAES